MSLNPIHGEMYLIQLNVIKFVSDFQQVSDLFVGDKSWYTVYLKQVDRNLQLTVSGNDNAISNTSTILLTNDAIGFFWVLLIYIHQ